MSPALYLLALVELKSFMSFFFKEYYFLLPTRNQSIDVRKILELILTEVCELFGIE